MKNSILKFLKTIEGQPDYEIRAKAYVYTFLPNEKRSTDIVNEYIELSKKEK